MDIKNLPVIKNEVFEKHKKELDAFIANIKNPYTFRVLDDENEVKNHKLPNKCAILTCLQNINKIEKISENMYIIRYNIGTDRNTAGDKPIYRYKDTKCFIAPNHTFILEV